MDDGNSESNKSAQDIEGAKEQVPVIDQKLKSIQEHGDGQVPNTPLAAAGSDRAAEKILEEGIKDAKNALPPTEDQEAA